MMLKQSNNLAGLALTKCKDNYEIKVIFNDGSDFLFKIKFTETEGATITVGLGEMGRL
jgi:hypothetical protein